MNITIFDVSGSFWRISIFFTLKNRYMNKACLSLKETIPPSYKSFPNDRVIVKDVPNLDMFLSMPTSNKT